MSVITGFRTSLRIFDEHRPDAPLRETTDVAEIARELAAIGVRFEQLAIDLRAPLGDDHGAIVDAARNVVEYVARDGGYATVDVVRVVRGQAGTEPMRRKFLSEHVHADDEVRYFVDGSGAFYLRSAGRVYQAICVRGDLLSVPAGVRHWFDMGPDPEFTAIRWFDNEDGWVAEFTGDTIAERFPLYE